MRLNIIVVLCVFLIISLTVFGSTDDGVAKLTKDLLALNKESQEIKSQAISPSLKQEAATKQTQILTTMKKTALARKEKMLALAEKDPNQFLTNAISSNTKQSFPAEIQKSMETEVSRLGKLEVIQIDDFKNKKVKYEYSLSDNGKEKALHIAGMQPMQSGTDVKIKGYELENNIVATIAGVNILQEPVPETIGPQRTLVLLIDYKDSPPRSMTRDQVFKLVFNGKLQTFFNEASYGKMSLTGDVIDWYRIPRTLAESDCSGEKDAQSVIQERGIDLFQYDRVVIVALGCDVASGTVGKTNWHIGGNRYKVSVFWMGILTSSRDELILYGSDGTFAHEYGHNLGAYHANLWNCKEGGPVYGQCTNKEYGNCFDVMGCGYAQVEHFNAFYKELFKWLTQGDVISISQSGEYILKPLETKEGFRLAKIFAPGEKAASYYLEFRQGLGFDAGLNDDRFSINKQGLFINMVRAPFPETFLLDMSPPSGVDETTVTLNKGVFTDAKKGVTIGPITKVTADQISFKVDFGTPQCIRATPKISAVKAIQVSPASTKTILFKIQNTDSIQCDPAPFSVDTITPQYWFASVIGTVYRRVTIPPQTETSLFLEVDMPQNELLGTYDLFLTGTNLDSGAGVTHPIQVVLGKSSLISMSSPILPANKYSFIFNPLIEEQSVASTLGSLFEWYDETSSFIQAEKIRGLSGYAVKLNSPQAISMSGNILSEIAVQVAGYSLIGIPSKDALPLAALSVVSEGKKIAMDQALGRLFVLYSWDDANQKWNKITDINTMLKPGIGYFVDASSPFKLKKS